MLALTWLWLLHCHWPQKRAVAYQDRGQGHKYTVSLHMSELNKLFITDETQHLFIMACSGDFPRHNYLIELLSPPHCHIFWAGSYICHTQTFQGEIAKWLRAVPLSKRPWMNHKNSSALLSALLINHPTKPFPNRRLLFLSLRSLEGQGMFSAIQYMLKCRYCLKCNSFTRKSSSKTKIQDVSHPKLEVYI